MHFMWLWITHTYGNYQQPFYTLTIHQRHAFWLLICIIQLLSSVTVCIIPGNICLTILYLYYQPSPSCYCCYLHLSGHFSKFSISVQYCFWHFLCLALNTKNSSHLYPCLFQCCSSPSIHSSPLLHFKLKFSITE